VKNLYGRLWRWHFFGALIVIPFVLWQSVTGTLYLWSEWWMDQAHAELRFVKPQQQQLPLGEQIRAALQSAESWDVSTNGAEKSMAGSVPPSSGAAHHHGMVGPSLGIAAQSSRQAHATHHGVATSGLAVQRALISEEPNRSTIVLFQGPDGLPFPVFVDPYAGTVLGQLSATAWLPGITRALHGGWPLGDPGSWLLELGDGWAILMLATGLYLWWPRGRGAAALLPRTGAGTRVLLRDLHSCVAAWFSVVFLFFLVSALPWTAFWGGKVLSTIESNTGQKSPAGFSPGGASVAQFASASLPIGQAVAAARQAGVHGTLDIRLAPWPGAQLFMTNTHVLPSQDRTLLADPVAGALRGDFNNEQIPVIPRLVALGIHVHQADFGAINVWLNTAFAGSLIWLCVTGVLSWWKRRPAGTVGAPARARSSAPGFVGVIVTIACVLMPLFGASILVIILTELGVTRLRNAIAR
jgi:uncharacterized iron-regulated membrane protein